MEACSAFRLISKSSVPSLGSRSVALTIILFLGLARRSVQVSKVYLHTQVTDSRRLGLTLFRMIGTTVTSYQKASPISYLI